MVFTAPTTYEQPLWQSGLTSIVGIDEVGRGAWAGPMVIGAVIFPPFFATTLPINDSKKLSPKLRTQLAAEITSQALCARTFFVESEIINTHGLTYATQYGFSQILLLLEPLAQHILIDAFQIKSVPVTQQTAIIKGDSLSLSIAAASIVAKVTRDNYMQGLHEQDSRYGFDNHVGYGTAAHREAIKKFGLSQFHRTSYDLSKWTSASITKQ